MGEFNFKYNSVPEAKAETTQVKISKLIKEEQKPLEKITLEEFKGKLLSHTPFTGYVKNIGMARADMYFVGYNQLLDIQYEALRQMEDMARKRKDAEAKAMRGNSNFLSVPVAESDATRVNVVDKDYVEANIQIQDYAMILRDIKSKLGNALREVSKIEAFQRDLARLNSRLRQNMPSRGVPVYELSYDYTNSNSGFLNYMNSHSFVPASGAYVTDRMPNWLNKMPKGTPIPHNITRGVNGVSKVGGGALSLLSFILIGADMKDNGCIKTKHVVDGIVATIGLVCLGVATFMAGTAAAGVAATVGTVVATVWVAGELLSYFCNYQQSFSETISGWMGGNYELYRWEENQPREVQKPLKTW